MRQDSRCRKILCTVNMINSIHIVGQIYIKLRGFLSEHHLELIKSMTKTIISQTRVWIIIKNTFIWPISVYDVGIYWICRSVLTNCDLLVKRFHGQLVNKMFSLSHKQPPVISADCLLTLVLFSDGADLACLLI